MANDHAHRRDDLAQENHKADHATAEAITLLPVSLNTRVNSGSRSGWIAACWRCRAPFRSACRLVAGADDARIVFVGEARDCPGADGIDNRRHWTESTVARIGEVSQLEVEHPMQDTVSEPCSTMVVRPPASCTVESGPIEHRVQLRAKCWRQGNAIATRRCPEPGGLAKARRS